jgi:CRISPR/Cas system-associated exonuclease Cas4 (RecB family)
MTEKTSLYNGKIELNFDEGKHLYTVNGNTVYGVTSIVGVLDKPALLYWAVNQTILFLSGALKPGIILDEVQIKEVLDQAKMAHRVKKDKSADLGTMIHEWLEKYIKARIAKGVLPELPVNVEMRKAIDSFFQWAKDNKVALISAERKIYSDKYGYAGTLDLEAIVNGKRTIIDFKTSNAIYDEYFIQASAYLMALEEELNKPVNGGVIILRLPKSQTDNLEVKQITREEANDFIDVFLSCLRIYQWKMGIKRQQIIKSVSPAVETKVEIKEKVVKTKKPRKKHARKKSV